MRTYEYSSGSVTSLMSLQPCDSVSSPVEGTVFQLSTSETLLPLRPYPWSVSEYLFTVCDERIHACSGGDTIENTERLCWLHRREALSRGKIRGHGHDGLGPSTGARTEGESLIIVSQTTTWLSTLASVSYSAVTYTKSCFTFQLKTERRSASMPSVRTAWS